MPRFPWVSPLGLPGATSPTRYVGATASGAPVSGTFRVGDWVNDLTGAFWICTAGGSPGTWTGASVTPAGIGASANPHASVDHSDSYANALAGLRLRTTSYSIVSGDGVILCDASAGAITITLPAIVSASPLLAGSSGTAYRIVKTDTSANLVTVVVTGGDTILGGATLMGQSKERTFLADTTVGSAGAYRWIATPIMGAEPASVQAMLAQNYDIFAAGNGQKTPAAATLYLAKIMVPRTILVTNVWINVTVAGTSYTNTQVGLFSSAGVYLSAGPVWASGGTNALGTVGEVSGTLAAAQTIVGSETAFVWAALNMGTNNATVAQLVAAAGTTKVVNAGLAATPALMRFGTQTGHATNAMSTMGFTPSANTEAGIPIWFGLS